MDSIFQTPESPPRSQTVEESRTGGESKVFPSKILNDNNNIG